MFYVAINATKKHFLFSSFDVSIIDNNLSDVSGHTQAGFQTQKSRDLKVLTVVTTPEPVRPDIGGKMQPKCFQKWPKYMPRQFLYSFYKVLLFKIAQKSQMFLATFVGKFVAKNFQKSPNLVSLTPTTVHPCTHVQSKIFIFQVY